VQQLAQKLEEFGQAVDAKDTEIEKLNEELDSLTEDLKTLGGRVYSLEEELADREAQIANMDGDLQNLEDSTTRHSHVNGALKDKITSLKSQLASLAGDQDLLLKERNQLREQADQLALQSATAEERVRSESSARRALEDDLQRAMEREEAKTRELKAVTEKLHAREADLAKLDDAIRANKTQSSDRVVLEVEIDRFKRDLKRAEREADEAIQKANEASMKVANLVSPLRV
jgi:chromosome segregation ATPase